MSRGAAKAAPADEKGQQVAALCWRARPGGGGQAFLEILLVTSLRSRRWILPKGWPHPGLSLAQSAAREALEEAGVTGEVGVPPLGHYHYLKQRKDGSGRPCRVAVFSLRVRHRQRSWAEKNARDTAWLPAEQAAAKVVEPGLRRLLLHFAKAARAAA